jgi:transcription-repair coupling factor (superfamily II helicase)
MAQPLIYNTLPELQDLSGIYTPPEHVVSVLTVMDRHDDAL